MLAVIVGAGRVGMDLIELLLPEGYDISVIELDKSRAGEMSEKFDILVIQGDATSLDILRDSHIESADIFVAVTGDDNANLVSSQLAKKVFKVRRIIARVNNPRNENIFSQLGITNTVSTTRASAMFIKNEISDIKTVLSVAGGKAHVLEVNVTKESFVLNKKIMEAKIPSGCSVVTVLRAGEGNIIPDGKTIFEEGDVVTLLVHKDRLKEVRHLFLGKNGGFSKIMQLLSKKKNGNM